MTTIAVRDVRLFVDVVGHGYPLVLMHGGPGADHWTLRPFRQLSDQFTLVFKAGRDRDYPGVFAAPLMPLTLVRLGVAWMARHSAHKINLYVTNVPGPVQPLWFAGARLRAAYPLPPLIAGVPLAVGVLSYAGTLTLTVTAPPGVPVTELTDGAQAAMTSFDIPASS